MELKNYQLEYIRHIRKTYDSIQFDKTLPTVMLEHIRTDFGYERELKNMSEYLGSNADNLLDVFNILGLIARHTLTMTEFANRLQQLEKLARTSHLQNEASAITLTTLHSAKGLEFERVYMIDLIDGVLPSEREEEVEEDTRLFYVGITRAIRHLELISYSNRFKIPVKTSIFGRELNQIVSPRKKATNQPKTKKKKEPMHYRNENTITSESELIEGLKVRHIAFGEGEILSVSRGLIELTFTTSIKKFVIETCVHHGYLERL